MSVKSRVLVLGVVVLLIGGVLVLARHSGRSGRLRAAFGAEFLTRPDGYRGVSRHYGFAFRSAPLQMEEGLMYRAVADGAVDVIDGFSTDGRIPAYDLVMLKDDKQFFPPYFAAPLVRRNTLEQYPEIREVLNRLGGKISNEDMQELNYQVDEKGRGAPEVARDFLLSRRLIPPDRDPTGEPRGRVTVGGKNFTEQEILGEILATLIEHATDISVTRKLNLGSTMICFNALKAGDLDLYAEYTGTGLVNILKRGVITDPDEAHRVVTGEFRDRYDLVWLDPFGFNNTYTLTMRRELSDQLGIATISDLARYVNEAEGQ